MLSYSIPLLDTFNNYRETGGEASVISCATGDKVVYNPVYAHFSRQGHGIAWINNFLPILIIKKTLCSNFPAVRETLPFSLYLIPRKKVQGGKESRRDQISPSILGTFRGRKRTTGPLLKLVIWL